MNNEPVPTRRKFLGWGLSTSLASFMGMLIYPIIRFIIPPKAAESNQNSVIAAKADELEPNSAKIFPFANKPAILIRLASGEYRALTAVCTHLQCTVQYRSDFSAIWCACHNGRFDVNGAVISGPPPKPLEAFDVNLSGDEIIVSKRS